MSVVWDIETCSLPESELRAIMPPFDPDSVRTGNIKDTQKIALKIADSKAAYEADYFENAALDPLTGRVLCIGLLLGDKFSILDNPDEAQLLGEFWGRCVIPGRRMIGFNCFLFDWPFLIKRSWRYGIQPQGVRKGRYWSHDLIDLREVWQMNDRQAHGSLDSIAKHFGVGEKTVNGKNFAYLFETDRPKAIEYLQNDCELCRRIAERMGVL